MTEVASPDLFPALDEVLSSGDPAASLDFLIAQFLARKEFALVFEARLMKKRHELGLPLVQTDSVINDDYQAAVAEAAREAGALFLAEGNIERAWPYFRAVGETAPIEQAIARFEPREDMDGVIAIAFQEGVNPARGLDLILAQHGMCRAITAFGMTAVSKDRDRCIALLATNIHGEIVRRMGAAIEAHEGALPASTNLIELIDGRDWLFGEWDYYVDSSHLLSVIPYCVEITDAAVLNIFYELCEYGKHLSAQFQPAGVPPFENQCLAYGHYIQALLGHHVESHLDYFRARLAELDPDVVGDAPARALVRLLVSLNRHAEALKILLDNVVEDDPYGAPVPSALNLCYQAKDYTLMKDLARERGDLLSYAAGSILGRFNPESLNRPPA
ncbi:MAG: hypothetical protein M3N54_09015 [Acidobacteriota bacterium]|nr:hypothetical protein [Acidobacteriota bacterium]